MFNETIQQLYCSIRFDKQKNANEATQAKATQKHKRKKITAAKNVFQRDEKCKIHNTHTHIAKYELERT
jgi:hypothetical protein